MQRIVMSSFLIAVLIVTAASAQPTLDSLWPNADGLRFTHDCTYQEFLMNESTAGTAWLQFDGYAMTPGGQAQILKGGQPPLPDMAKAPYPGLLGQVWRARPDLRMKIAAMYGDAAKDESELWYSSFLSTGLFLKSADGIGMWHEYWNDTGWIYLKGDILPGASFVVQLLSELSPDFYLHGTVDDVAATITTSAGTFANAVKVAYRLEYGVEEMRDEEGNPQGKMSSEMRGYVFYVPDVGPVAMLQEFYLFATMDCGDQPCPPEWVPWIDKPVELQTLSLSQVALPTQTRTWGEIKALYR
ncbi:MAG: hypothetical protein IPO18_07260 [bacterium]|nr:hypothetical protein [bacterium]